MREDVDALVKPILLVYYSRRDGVSDVDREIRLATSKILLKLN